MDIDFKFFAYNFSGKNPSSNLPWSVCNHRQRCLRITVQNFQRHRWRRPLFQVIRSYKVHSSKLTKQYKIFGNFPKCSAGLVRKKIDKDFLQHEEFMSVWICINTILHIISLAYYLIAYLYFFTYVLLLEKKSITNIFSHSQLPNVDQNSVAELLCTKYNYCYIYFTIYSHQVISEIRDTL